MHRFANLPGITGFNRIPRSCGETENAFPVTTGKAKMPSPCRRGNPKCFPRDDGETQNAFPVTTWNPKSLPRADGETAEGITIPLRQKPAVLD